MPKKNKLPSGVTVRRDRAGTETYYFVLGKRKAIRLGQDLGDALGRWVKVQEGLIKQVPPRTALDLVASFQRCSLPFDDRYAAARRDSELSILKVYFEVNGDPPLYAITSERIFLDWYGREHRESEADDVIRMFRRIWNFAARLEVVRPDCPWNAVSLRKARLQMEIVDIIYPIARNPLKEVLAEILGKSGGPDKKTRPTNDDRDLSDCLRNELQRVTPRVVALLRESGRLDLVASVYRITVENLFSLRNSGSLMLIRPPGLIDLGHRRRELLVELKSKRDLLQDTSGCRSFGGEILRSEQDLSGRKK